VKAIYEVSEVERLIKERDWWKEQLRRELQGGYYSEDRVNREIAELESKMQKEIDSN